MSVLLASATLWSSWLSEATAGRLGDPLPCEPLLVEPPEGLTARDVLNTGGGVGVIRGAGGTVGVVPAGGVILTPTFILKLLFPRYTTLSFSPPGTSSATTSFLPFFVVGFGQLF